MVMSQKRISLLLKRNAGPMDRQFRGLGLCISGGCLSYSGISCLITGRGVPACRQMAWGLLGAGQKACGRAATIVRALTDVKKRGAACAACDSGRQTCCLLEPLRDRLRGAVGRCPARVRLDRRFPAPHHAWAASFNGLQHTLPCRRRGAARYCENDGGRRSIPQS